jgi:predicted transposase YbfD/YdcC
MDGDELPDRNLWKGLKSIGMVVRERILRGKIEREISYYILSLEIDANIFAKACRNHWGVENLLHGHLDVTFREDESRYRDQIGATNLAVIRKTTLAMLSKDTSKKCSLANKRLLAAVNSDYRENLINNFIQ